MKTYNSEYPHLTTYDLDNCLESHIDREVMLNKLNDIMTELVAKMRFLGENTMTYKDRLFAEDMFKKGYAAAFVELKNNETT